MTHLWPSLLREVKGERTFIPEVVPDRQEIVAFGERLKLQPGMALTANIILGRRSFLEWLLQPLAAVLRRNGDGSFR